MLSFGLMKKIDLNQVYDLDAVVSEIVQVLEKGGVVMMPSDTCYGFVGDASKEDVKNKICDLKEMPTDKPISVFVGEVYDVFEIMDFDDYGRELVLQYMPGMLTVIGDSKQGESLGIRVPDHGLMQAVAKKFGKPLFTTSANKHGQESPYGLEVVVDQFGGDFNNIDLVVDGGVLDANRPSTVVRVLDHDLEILREGELAEVLKIHYGL